MSSYKINETNHSSNHFSPYRIADINKEQSESNAECAELESKQLSDHKDEIRTLSKKEENSLKMQAAVGVILVGIILALQITNECLPSDYNPLKRLSSDKNTKKIPLPKETLPELSQALDLEGLSQTKKTIPIKHKTPNLSSRSAGLDLAGLSQTEKAIPEDLFKKIQKKHYCLPISKKIRDKNESQFKSIVKIFANALPGLQHPIDKYYQFKTTPIKTNQYLEQIQISHIIDQNKRTRDTRDKDQHVLSVLKTLHDVNSVAIAIRSY